MIITRSVLLEMGYISIGSCKENRNTHFMFNNFFPENRAVCENRCKNILEADRQQMEIWRTRVASWIPEITNTHTEYVIIIAFPLQQ
jgi:hypothetical protein